MGTKTTIRKRQLLFALGLFLATPATAKGVSATFTATAEIVDAPIELPLNTMEFIDFSQGHNDVMLIGNEVVLI